MHNAIWLYRGMEHQNSTCHAAVAPKELVDLNQIFGALFRASLKRDASSGTIEFVLESKCCEIMAAFKEMQKGADEHPEVAGDMNRMIARGLYFLLGVLTANIDLPKVASHVRPCGTPECGCHDVQLMVVRSLQMIRDGMEAQHNRVTTQEGSGK